MEGLHYGFFQHLKMKPEPVASGPINQRFEAQNPVQEA
jgi:hypothetical protein